jgi:hypothetical protein
MKCFTADNKDLRVTGPGTVLTITALILLIPFFLYPYGIANDYPNHYVAFSIAFEQLQGVCPTVFMKLSGDCSPISPWPASRFLLY